MKKLCNILLCLALIAAMTLTVSATGSSVTLAASTKSVQAGQKFTVEAVLDNSDAILMGTVALSYNENALELIGGTCHVADTSIAQVLPSKKAGTFMVGGLPKKVSGKIFTFEFRVRDSVAQGTYEIAAKAAIGVTGGDYIDVKSAQIKVDCTHSAEEQWRSNYAQHWHFCTGCGDRLDAAAHTPRSAEDKTCAVCSYVPVASNEETTPVIAPEQNVPQTPSKPADSQKPEGTTGQDATAQATQPTGQLTDQPTEPQTEQTDTVLPSQTESVPEETGSDESADQKAPEKGGAFWWWIIGLVVVGGGAAAGFVIFKRKKN